MVLWSDVGVFVVVCDVVRVVVVGVGVVDVVVAVGVVVVVVVVGFVVVVVVVPCGKNAERERKCSVPNAERGTRTRNAPQERRTQYKTQNAAFSSP